MNNELKCWESHEVTKQEKYNAKQKAKSLANKPKPKKAAYVRPAVETKGWTPSPVVKADFKSKTIIPKPKESPSAT